jgi:hypothetical protein
LERGIIITAICFDPAVASHPMKFSKTPYSLPERLIEASRHRRLIPFVGAGLSRQADPNRFPSWRELLHNMLKRFVADRYLDPAEASSLLGMLKGGNNPQAVAETIKARVPQDAYQSFLQQQFSHTPKRPSVSHSQLFRLNSPVIITTNYDRLIEDAYAHEKGKALSVVCYDQPGQVRNRLLTSLSQDAPFLFKLHGDIENPGGIILTSHDYARLRQHNQGYRLLLSSIFYHYTTLFIGFSLSDPEILLHLQNIQDALSGERYPDYAFLPDTSCSEAEVSDFRRTYGIHVILYKTSRRRNAHKLLTQYLTHLADNT